MSSLISLPFVPSSFFIYVFLYGYSCLIYSIKRILMEFSFLLFTYSSQRLYFLLLFCYLLASLHWNYPMADRLLNPLQNSGGRPEFLFDLCKTTQQKRFLTFNAFKFFLKARSFDLASLPIKEGGVIKDISSSIPRSEIRDHCWSSLPEPEVIFCGWLLIFSNTNND